MQCGDRTASYIAALASIVAVASAADATEDCSLPPPPPPPPPPITDRLHSFLRGDGVGPDDKYTIVDIMGWEYTQMERVHNYIQWVRQSTLVLLG